VNIKFQSYLQIKRIRLCRARKWSCWCFRDTCWKGRTRDLLRSSISRTWGCA